MKLLTLKCAPSISLVAVTVLAIGCGQTAVESGVDVANVSEASLDVGDDHGDWWCAEHSVPEEQCSICSSKAADEFKANGDWCEAHNRAESQCFECDSSRADKFAKLYEAKFGHEPPKLTQ